MQISKKQAVAFVGTIALAGASVAMATANASNVDADFTPVVNLLTNWSNGTLGRTVALGMFVVGLAAGVMNQSIMAVVVGVSGAVAFAYGPGIISSVFSASI